MFDALTNILLIEDNFADAQLIKILLSPASHDSPNMRFHIHHAASLETGLALLQAESVDLILLDLSLPDSQGIGTFAAFAHVALPIVILSGIEDEETAVHTVQNGAQDYLVKGEIDAKLLSNAIRYAIERHQLLRQLQEKSSQLRASEQRRRSIIEHNPDGILIIDKRGIVRFVNPAAEAILHQSKQTLLGQPFELPIEPTHITPHTITRPDGSNASVEMRLAETEWEGTAVYQASLRDISEHQNAKQQLSQKAAELEARNADLDAFSHTLAHQIRGLLSQIIGYASFAEAYHADETNPELQLVLKRILNSSHKMNSVMQELLTLASVRSGEVEREQFDMQQVVDAALKRLAFLQEQYSGEIIQATSLPHAVGHPGWIEEVWVNYISNGFKYGGEPPTLTIGFEQLEHRFGRFWVQDNGEGLTPTEQKRLFRPHTRLKKRLVRGEGLGLSIVDRIVHKCGGKVGVESERGQGSRFWFTLPLEP